MKRGKKFLFYICSITFCCLFIFFFTNSKLKAIDANAYSFSCIDRNDKNVCDDSTGYFYYELTSIDISEDEALTIKELVIPSTFDDGVHGVSNVESISSNVINTTSSTPLNLDEIVLPSNLRYISDAAFAKVATIKEIEIPTTTESIGDSIFDENSVIEKIYINAYVYDGNIGYIDIADEAFKNVAIDSIICGNHSVYRYFSTDADSGLNEFNLVTSVKYIYYASENEMLTEKRDEITYYISNKESPIINEIASDLSVAGLDFVGWNVKLKGQKEKLELNGNLIYDLGTEVYSVYPEFKIKELTFDITATNVLGQTVNKIKYDGSDDLVEIKAINIEHEIINNISKTFVWYKIIDDENKTEVSKNEHIYLSNVNQTGKYMLEISYKYDYDGLEYKNVAQTDKNQYKDITITKAPLYVSVEDVTKTYGEYMSDEDVKYTVNGLVNQTHLIDENYVLFSYENTGRIDAGNYPNGVQVEITSIKENGIEKISNYNIVYSYGNYKVLPKVVDAYFDETKDFIYGEQIEISKIYEFEDIYGKYDEQVVVTFNKNPGLIVGEYGIAGVKEISNSNYLASYNKDQSTGKVVILSKKVEPQFEIDSYTYNGLAKEINVYYNDINGVKVYVPFVIKSAGVEVNAAINHGVYSVHVDSLNDTNYDFVDETYKTTSFTIEKALPVITYSAYQEFTYSGNKIDPHVSINNNEQTPIFKCLYGGLQGNYCVNAGSYSVVVSYQESANYKAPEDVTIRLDISKKYIYLAPKSFKFYYNEIIDAKEEIEINGEKIIVKYNTNAEYGADLGKYDITGAILQNSVNGSDHPNYIGSISLNECKEKIEVVSRPITIVYYNYTDLVYNGKEREVGAYAIDNISNKVVNNLKLTLKCDEGSIKDAKTYHLRAYFDNPYYVATNSNLLKFEIAKATYDVSKLKFNNKTFTLDFKEHSIFVEGKLPEGVSVKYTIDDKEGNSTSSAFSHKVVASFEIDAQNYLPIDNMEATIYIDMSWVFITFSIVVLVAAIAICLSLLYVKYRREHPKKIKLKIKSLVQEDLEAKRVASSVKDVLGDEIVEHEIVENDDDLIDDNAVVQNFIDRIYAADSELKYYYSEVKNELLSYDGIKHSVDRKFEVFHHGTRQIAKLSICNGVLKLYVNLDPDKYDKSQYNHRDMSKFDCHARTPLRIDVDTTESLRHAKVFIRILRKKENLKAVSSFVKIDYEKFYTLKENFLPRIFKRMTARNKKKEKK